MISLQVKGIPINILNPIIGIIKNDDVDKDTYIVDSLLRDKKILLSKKSIYNSKSIGVFNININYLTPGDIVVLFPNGVVKTLFRIESADNSIFMTNTCNQNCIMCSQPPQNKNDIEQQFNINYSLIDFIPLTTRQIGISGGEPLLCCIYLNHLLTKLFSRIELINVFILTNAVLLSDIKYFQNLQGLPKDRILFSVPLYGDNQFTHDSIVRSKGSFNKTIIGIYNLYKHNYRVELRVIPQKKNIMRLEKLSHFIYSNLTFVENVAFMGIENIGNANKNSDEIWLTPDELKNPLKKATEFLKMSGINCSLYNYPNCVLSKQLQLLSLQTISDWKREYLPQCLECKERNNCGGIFNSSIDLMKQYIEPIID